jgi:hypothetical protein
VSPDRSDYLSVDLGQWYLQQLITERNKDLMIPRYFDCGIAQSCHVLSTPRCRLVATSLRCVTHTELHSLHHASSCSLSCSSRTELQWWSLLACPVPGFPGHAGHQGSLLFLLLSVHILSAACSSEAPTHPPVRCTCDPPPPSLQPGYLLLQESQHPTAALAQVSGHCVLTTDMRLHARRGSCTALRRR